MSWLYHDASSKASGTRNIFAYLREIISCLQHAGLYRIHPNNDFWRLHKFIFRPSSSSAGTLLSPPESRARKAPRRPPGWNPRLSKAHCLFLQEFHKVQSEKFKVQIWDRMPFRFLSMFPSIRSILKQTSAIWKTWLQKSIRDMLSWQSTVWRRSDQMRLLWHENGSNWWCQRPDRALWSAIRPRTAVVRGLSIIKAF